MINWVLTLSSLQTSSLYWENLDCANASNYTHTHTRAATLTCIGAHTLKLKALIIHNEKKKSRNRIKDRVAIFITKLALSKPFPTMHWNLSSAAIIKAASENIFKKKAVSRCKQTTHRGIYPKTMSDCVDRAFVRVFVPVTCWKESSSVGASSCCRRCNCNL